MRKLSCDKCEQPIEGDHYCIEELEFYHKGDTAAELRLSKATAGNWIEEAHKIESWVSYRGIHLHPDCTDITVAELIRRIEEESSNA